jgi:uncharacterized coiled-coil protein SlyX
VTKHGTEEKMFDTERNGYNRREVDYYITRLEDDFQNIIKGHTERLANVKRNVTELASDLNEYSQVVPQYKSEIESLRERLTNIQEFANTASSARYLQGAQPEVLLANLIAQILTESSAMSELKPVEPAVSAHASGISGDDFFEILAGSKELKLDEALSGFDFFDNNPYKSKAEKRLKKIEAKRAKRAR